MDSPKSTPPLGRQSSLESLQSQQGDSSDKPHAETDSHAGGRTVQKRPPDSPRMSYRDSYVSEPSEFPEPPFDRSLLGRRVSLADEPDFSSQTFEPFYDISCDIDPTVEEDYVVGSDGCRVQVKEERDRLLADRADVMAEQRTLLAQEYMKAKGPVFLKALSDPEFARANDINIVLEIGGRTVQLAPPLDDQGVSQADMETYRRYVFSSTSNVLKSIPPLKTLRAEMKENDKVFEKSRKKLKKLGAKIDLKLQSKMLREDTRIVMELSNNSGVIYGVPGSEIYLPDEMLKHAPKATLASDHLYVRMPDEDIAFEDDDLFGADYDLRLERESGWDEPMEDDEGNMVAESERSDDSGVDPAFRDYESYENNEETLNWTYSPLEEPLSSRTPRQQSSEDGREEN